MTEIRDKTGNGERRAMGKGKMGTKKWIGNEVTDRAALEFKLIFVVLFIFPSARSPFSSVIIDRCN